jgi:hypothetical protein
MDIEKLRKKLAETQERMKSGGGGGDFKFWSPKDGRNVVRILPPKPGTEDFYVESRVHYNVGPNKKMVTCGKVARGTCAVCDFVDALFKSGDKEDEKLAKRMKATSRYYFNVVDRTVGEKDEGYGDILVFGAGATIFTDILGIIVDPDFGDITDPDNGRDVIITKSGKQLDTEYKTQARPVQTELGIDKWEEKMVDLSLFLKPRSDEDLEAILEGKEPSGNKDDKGDNDSKPAGGKASGGGSKPSADEDEGEELGSDADDIEAEIAAVLSKHGKK